MLNVAHAHAASFHAAGVASVDDLLRHPTLAVWRRLDGRANATVDVAGLPRLHLKIYNRAAAGQADAEMHGAELLRAAGVPAIDVVAHGRAADGSGVTASVDLAGYRPADKLVADGALDFAALTAPTAALAARLHSAGLHHRDLYLCHFFVRPTDLDVRLIDVGRVRRLPGWPWRRRWVVKDLAAVWYSAGQLGVGDEARLAWLSAYGAPGLRSAVVAKSAAIGRHDARLAARQPDRNVSIPRVPQLPGGGAA